MPAPLLTTKLYVPPVRPSLVLRSRLVEQLDAVLDRKVALVSAQAGFGKTTLVADWLSRLECPYTWLSLDEGDNDPVRFVTYLVAALQKIDEGVGEGLLSLLGAPQLPPIESLVTLIINDVAATSERFVLVLDDYHTVHEAWIHEAMEFLIERQPTQLRLVLVTRQDPPLPLPRLRVRGQVVEVCEQDLRFTQEEVAGLLSRELGLDLDAGTITALEARTEGWIAGLQLAALSMQGKPPERIAEFVELFRGSHRHVIDYLAEEVLAEQSREMRDFLCQTAILGRLTAPLCDAVTGRSDSKELLRRVEQANLFLVPLDDQRQWYRYHRLFADFLRTELDADTRAALHRRASRWLVAHDLLPEAVEQALASGDWDESARVVALASAEAFRAASLVTLEGWLGALPDEVVRSRTDLATFRGFVLFFTGRTSEAVAYAEAGERCLPSDASPSSRGRLLSLQAHLAMCTGDLDATIGLAEEALDSLDASDTEFRNLTLNVLGQVLEMRGDVAAAADVYREAALGERRVGNQVGALVVLTNLVFALNELGRRKEAVAICRQAVEEAKSQPGRPLPVSEGMALAWSLLSYEANQLERARQQVVPALDLAEQMNITDGILWGRQILARVHLACGDLGAARRIAQEGRRYAERLDVYRGKVWWFSALEAEADLRQGDATAASRWVAEASLSPTDSPLHWDELVYFAYVRLLLSENRLEDAQTLLSTMELSALQGQRYRKLITIHLQQALVQHRMGQTKQALDRVERALRLAAPENYRRAFLDEGQTIVELLPRVRTAAPYFVDQVLADAGAGQAVPRAQALVEPMSERELQILRLIAAGRSNPEIADLLYLSLNTIKWHVKNIFGKLDVRSRVEAVARAQELDLL